MRGMNKFFTFLVCLLIVTALCSFQWETNEKVGFTNKSLQTTEIKNPKDQDVSSMLEELGIQTKVNEQLLAQNNPGVIISNNDEDDKLRLEFYNPNEKNYTLNIYGPDGQLVVSYINIYSPYTIIDKAYFDSDIYTYKLTGEGNTYAGRFQIGN